jgi:hypothetical protein
MAGANDCIDSVATEICIPNSIHAVAAREQRQPAAPGFAPENSKITCSSLHGD